MHNILHNLKKCFTSCYQGFCSKCLSKYCRIWAHGILLHTFPPFLSRTMFIYFCIFHCYFRLLLLFSLKTVEVLLAHDNDITEIYNFRDRKTALLISRQSWYKKLVRFIAIPINGEQNAIKWKIVLKHGMAFG